MQKIRVGLLMMVMCGSSFFVKVSKGENSATAATSTKAGVQQRADRIYNELDFGKADPLSPEVFRKAYTGFLNLKAAGKLGETSVLSICDFSLSANVKRLWVIDLAQHKVLFHSLVAHGQGTGEEFALNFSNLENSHQSSLGFYVTQDTYNGDNGYSLRLQGMDAGYNDAAFNRAIVMHGAPYVCDSYIRDNKRLGRSWGCPAVPTALAQPIINTIKDRTCLYIYYPNRKYMAQSVWLNKAPQLPEEDLIQEEFRKQLHRQQNALPQAKAADTGKQATLAAAPAVAEPEVPMYQGVRLNTGRN